MKLSEFNYELPEELIAKYPSENRDESRLMVVHKDRNTSYLKTLSPISTREM